MAAIPLALFSQVAPITTNLTAQELTTITAADIDNAETGILFVSTLGDAERLGLPGGRQMHLIETYLNSKIIAGTGVSRGLQRATAPQPTGSGVWVRDRTGSATWSDWKRVA